MPEKDRIRTGAIARAMEDGRFDDLARTRRASEDAMPSALARGLRPPPELVAAARAPRASGDAPLRAMIAAKPLPPELAEILGDPKREVRGVVVTSGLRPITMPRECPTSLSERTDANGKDEK